MISLIENIEYVSSKIFERDEMDYEEIPLEFWQEMCNVTSIPLACVAKNNKFIWVNSAWEKLVGYSVSELREKTWQEITVHQDVGGDVASVQAIMDGRVDSYTLSKRYRHKFGHDLPINLSVWKFPNSSEKALVCFIVEAESESVSYQEFFEAIELLKSRIRQMEKNKQGVSVQVDSHRSNRGDTIGDLVGRDKTTNDSKQIRYLICGFIALSIAFAWSAYYIATLNKPDVVPVQPPNNISSDLEGNQS